MVAPGPTALLALEIHDLQLYGLVFLLGSFAVAALSDVKHLHAQREFVEVWTILALALLAVDVWRSVQVAPLDASLVLKWTLVATFAALSHRRVGVLFHLARGDLAACVAASALLPAGLVPALWILLKLLEASAAGLLRDGRLQYPFMPLVTAATVVVAAAGRWAVPALLG